MSNDYYTHGTFPTPNAPGSSALLRAELDLIEAGFSKLPDLTGNAGKVVVVNAGATGLETNPTTATSLAFVANVTSDIQAQLNAKAPLASPALTGTPTAPTAGAGTNTTQLATTAFVIAERSNAATLTNKTLSSPIISNPSGLVKGDVGLGNVDNTSDASKPISSATQAALDLKAPLASPALTGTPTAPTASPGTNNTQVATTAFVQQTAFASTLPDQTGNSGKYLTTDGANASWSSVGGGTVTSVALSAPSFLSVGGSPVTSTGTLTLTYSGTALPEANGGTGQTSYTTGDLLFASGAATLSKLADVATGNALISGGVGVAPSWGKVGLTTHVTGTLDVGNGGTGITSYAVGDIVYASGSAVLSKLAGVAAGNVLLSGGVNTAPSWGKVTLSGGSAHVSGTLPVGNGGTGAITLTGLVKGNGTSAFTAAVAGTDFLAPAAVGSTVQAWDADLDAIAALAGTSGLLRKTAANTWSLDTASYLTGNQTVTLSGDVSGSGTTSISVTLATVPVAKGGTGATSASAARTNLGLGSAATMTGPTGTIVGTTDTQTLTNKTVTGLAETRVAMGANNVDLSAGNYFTKTLSAGSVSLTVSNTPASGTAASFILDLTNGGTATITWWSGMKWAGGAAPTLTSSGRDVLGFFTHDGGTTWSGLLLGKDVK